MQRKKQINVLIVDDSLSMRKMLEDHLLRDPDIKIMGKAKDPYEAAAFLKKQVPDVITLDIEMPKMDGLTFLKKIMSQHPIPVVIISSLTNKGATETIKALEYGAVEIIQKPFIKEGQEEQSIQFIIDKVRSASLARVKSISQKQLLAPPKFSADAVLSKKPVPVRNLPKQKHS